MKVGPRNDEMGGYAAIVWNEVGGPVSQRYSGAIT